MEEAPAECPTCRTECFADAETGEPQIHRLFINFGEGLGYGEGPSSSQAGSSPAKGWAQGKGKDREVLGLARRARGLGEEARGIKAESTEEEVEGFLRRADGLKGDLISEKALTGVKVSCTFPRVSVHA